MRSAGAILPTHAARNASSAAIDRWQKHRDGAHKSLSMYGDSAGVRATGASSTDEREYLVALCMDMLEGVVGDGATISLDVNDDEYDEFAEFDKATSTVTVIVTAATTAAVAVMMSK